METTITHTHTLAITGETTSSLYVNQNFYSISGISECTDIYKFLDYQTYPLDKNYSITNLNILKNYGLEIISLVTNNPSFSGCSNNFLSGRINNVKEIS
jgi:hypothetical protein